MEKAGDILRALLNRDQGEKARLYGAFFRSWERVAGEQLAAHSSIQDIRNGSVVVEADHPGWLQMIQLRQEELLAGLRLRFPELNIQGLRLQLPLQGKPGPGFRAPEPPSASEAPEAADRRDALDRIPDGELRRLLESLGKRIQGQSDGQKPS